jgi:hypothetical protein
VPGHARRHAQRRVLNVGSLLAEDRAEQLLFRRQLRLAFRRDLAYQHVTGFDFRTDVDDPGLVEVGELVLREVGDVPRDLFGSQLRVASDDRELLDVDRGEALFRDHALRDQDRVLEVVAVPGHERDEHVLPERELAGVGRRAVRNHVTAGDAVAHLDERTLVDVRVLVRALVLHQVVDVHADFTGGGLVVVHADHDTAGVDVIDHAATARLHRRAGVDRDRALEPRADERLLGTQARHSLPLHVGAHQRAVRVVMLEERNERRGDGYGPATARRPCTRCGPGPTA